MNLKQRLKNGEHLLGTMVTTFASADMAKLLKQYGFDFFIIDCEHGSFTTREAADMISVARAIGLPAMVRIPEMRREHALKFTEMGANGILLPNTESAEQAQMLVDCTKYAPLGHRGVSLSRPHTDFAKVDGRSYMARANDENILLCQIESRAGVTHIDEIMAVDGIDAALIGPNDMTQDYGKLDHFDDPEIVDAIGRVVSSAKTHGKFSGAHFGASAPLLPWIKRGMQLNMWSSDIGLMSLGAAAGLPALREAGK
jgi:2-dehydro-3-deoxyglucarate aldolase/4-hydroxy-2-oxoheptanedioate aldolase